jgi:hypothetical protein
VDGVAYYADDNEMIPDYALEFALLTKPLFKAYCLLFAALGCLEITVQRPRRKAVLDGEEIPVSPYDGVCALRLTAQGKWLLDLSREEPPAPPAAAVIADDTLHLVTLCGESVKRRVFLDKIGTRIGENRWAVNAASFIRGCAHRSEAASRVETLRALIGKPPAPHWEALFAAVTERAGALEEVTDAYCVYKLTCGESLCEDLRNNAAFRAVARSAGSGLVVVAKSDRERLLALLADLGISVLAPAHG